MLSLKLFLISTAVIFTALGLKSSLPLATTHLTLLWNFFLLCFTPPYLIFTVNAIIISILASSRFHQSYNHPIVDPTPPPIVIVNTVHVDVPTPSPKQEEEEEEPEEETKQIDLGILKLKRMDSPENLPLIDKPLLSTRFTHRKPLKFSPEGGKSLKVAAKQKRHETLENTWKMITEGRSMPLTRHMKKCDTWQNRYDAGPHEPQDSAVTVSDFNFNKTWKLRKEPSLSQDELNKRVEAFIRKFNQQMRLQREESLNHYMQMINHGAS
ncbi:uncharacterized protein LOC123905553 isoform X2 [Trifolium pratense]|uniref:uncharacterized protein LOC123905553 isoform X1 n=1 Tax=Trifolium pratense TaxID=57577 RepID=UPI001E692101|nr:uncharacterized protein LOC123905553 isoform X1 [Trifolium pratense]XP_045811158.1 uncharacterized protein LOC123905553 isoform X1 [Trifolium pratense]XP_045811161.1 uncharacterized protein LOC123905553 isoform X2 [Trifolium pratense]